ncbi:MAG: hypothetical protein IIZ61_08440 [Lachnospiraceae bacterium]|nr:hypothetical protein [Lachnospiraceae bacterium]
MSISINSNNAYLFSYNRNTSSNNKGSGSFFKSASKNPADNPVSNQPNNTNNSKLAEKIKGLNNPASDYVYRGHKETDSSQTQFISYERKNHTYKDTSENKVNGYLNTKTETTSKKTSDETVKKKLNYSYKEISTQILRAKNSVSAEQVVIKAKRKVLELKRKMGNKNIDPDELSVAINHAKSMERVAKKKKHNLELEELAEITSERDERMEEQEEAGKQDSGDRIEGSTGSVYDATSAVIEETEEEISDRLTELDKAETAMEIQEAYPEHELFNMDDMEELIESFSEEEKEMLEQQLDMLGQMEIIDPHMTEEDLKELKQKHRNAEQKQIVKAEMEYLKQTYERMQRAGAEAIQKMNVSNVQQAQPSVGVVSGFIGASYTPSAAELVNI